MGASGNEEALSGEAHEALCACSPSIWGRSGFSGNPRERDAWGGSRKKGMSRREQALRLREAGVMLSRGYSLPEGEGWRVRRPCTCQH